jgi:isocitrate/methylisocitrate lyase
MGSRPNGQRGRRNQEGVISMSATGEQAALLQHQWQTSPRWAGVTRDYSARDVIRLRGRVAGEHGLARRGATRLWALLHSQDAVAALGAVPGNAGQLPAAGSQAIYLPGPMTQAVREASDALLRADRFARAQELRDGIVPTGRGLAPVVAGAGGAPDAFELMTAMIGAGAAGVCFEDQLPAGNERGHLGGKVLVPTGQHVQALAAARFAADVLDVPSLVIARTCARTASLLTSDADERDHEFLTGERTPDGLYRVNPGLYASGTRALAFAPYADLLWMETPAPDLAAARAFACVIHSQYPGKLLAYSCPPSSNGRAHLDDASAARFRQELAAMGYRFQVTTPAGFPAPDESAPRPQRAHTDLAARAHPDETEFALAMPLDLPPPGPNARPRTGHPSTHQFGGLKPTQTKRRGLPVQELGAIPVAFCGAASETPGRNPRRSASSRLVHHGIWTANSRASRSLAAIPSDVSTRCFTLRSSRLGSRVTSPFSSSVSATAVTKDASHAIR